MHIPTNINIHIYVSIYCLFICIFIYLFTYIYIHTYTSPPHIYTSHIYACLFLGGCAPTHTGYPAQRQCTHGCVGVCRSRGPGPGGGGPGRALRRVEWSGVGWRSSRAPGCSAGPRHRRGPGPPPPPPRSPRPPPHPPAAPPPRTPPRPPPSPPRPPAPVARPRARRPAIAPRPPGALPPPRPAAPRRVGGTPGGAAGGSSSGGRARGSGPGGPGRGRAGRGAGGDRRAGRRLTRAPGAGARPRRPARQRPAVRGSCRRRRTSGHWPRTGAGVGPGPSPVRDIWRFSGPGSAAALIPVLVLAGRGVHCRVLGREGRQTEKACGCGTGRVVG